MQFTKKVLSFCLIALLMISTVLSTKAFADTKDGTYDVDYTVLKDGTSDVSIANDYFNKPGKLVVKNGEKHLQLTMNHSHWIKGITVDGSSEEVVSEDKSGDVRTSNFKVKSSSGKINGTITVYINEEVDGKPFLYDNKYKIVFDVKEPSGASSDQGQATTTPAKKDDSTSGTATSKSTDKNSNSTGTTTASTTKDVKNPQTSARTPAVIFTLPIFAGLILVVTFVFSRKMKRGHN